MPCSSRTQHRHKAGGWRVRPGPVSQLFPSAEFTALHTIRGPCVSGELLSEGERGMRKTDSGTTGSHFPEERGSS